MENRQLGKSRQVTLKYIEDYIRSIRESKDSTNLDRIYDTKLLDEMRDYVPLSSVVKTVEEQFERMNLPHKNILTFKEAEISEIDTHEVKIGNMTYTTFYGVNGKIYKIIKK
jgi:hypothetical protein